MNRSRIALFLLLVFALTGAYFVWKPAAEVPAAVLEAQATLATAVTGVYSEEVRALRVAKR
jgi:hypothetical protein